MLSQNTGIQQAKPESMKFAALIQAVASGKVKVPQFQRDFVWNIRQTAELLDSMIKGYPIGTFILWETTERMNSVKNIGDLAEIPESRDGEKIAYVLDGQQRITSLFAAHQGATIRPAGEKKATNYKEIFVTLRNDSENDGEPIVTTVAPDGEHVPLREILSAFSGGNHLTSLMDPSRFSEDARAKITQYLNALINYDFSTIILQSGDMDVAIEVFTRINTSGKTLTLFEIMSAKTYDEKKCFDMHEKWQQFVEDCKTAKFESISSTVILYILAAVLSDSKECKKKTILRLKKEDIIENWDSVVDALRQSITYMRTKLRVPVSGLLPYDSLLVPFAYFYYRRKGKGTPSEQQQKLLEEFFWWVSLSHRYSTSVESRLAQDIRKIDSILKEEAPAYDSKVDLHNASVLHDYSFRASDSYCKAVLCLLAAEKPLDFETNGEVILDNSWLRRADSKNYHHFFPKKYLETQRQEHPAWHDNANSVMNITFVRDGLNKGRIGSKSPADYIKEFEKNNSQIKETLATHLIDREKDGIDENDYDLFLQNRAKSVFEKLRAKLSEATRP